MTRHAAHLLASLGLLAAGILPTSLGAQSIRGTVLDDASKLPISSVMVTLLDDAGVEVPRGVRTDSLGAFMVHAARAGTWRVKAMRIGYSPVTSERVVLTIGGLAVVRLRMTTVAQQLVPVQILEQRMLSANELMSTAGFDLRRSRGLGRFLSAEQLADMGQDGVREVLANFFQPTLFVDADSVLGDVLRMRQGMARCPPEVFLDGRLLATTPRQAAITDGPQPITAMDSMRAQMRRESDQMRVGFDQIAAMTLLTSLSAEQLHGIEVYRNNEVPPASLGAWFGLPRAAIRSCGTVAVWTKAGALSIVTARNANVPGRAVQVVMGTLVDYDTGTPLSGRSVSLLSEAREPIGSPVVTDERGDFTMRTGRAGELRLSSGGTGYLEAMTPPFRVSANELVLVKLFVSARDGVLAPLGVVARVLPQSVGLASLAGFTYRRERAQGGTFFRAADIERSNARSLPELLRSVEGVSVTDTPAPGTITVTRTDRGTTSSCAPAYYLDGRMLTGNVTTTIAALPMSRIFGVEVYSRASEIPHVFTDAGACGLVVVWTKG